MENIFLFYIVLKAFGNFEIRETQVSENQRGRYSSKFNEIPLTKDL